MDPSLDSHKVTLILKRIEQHLFPDAALYLSPKNIVYNGNYAKPRIKWQADIFSGRGYSGDRLHLDLLRTIQRFICPCNKYS